MIMTVGQLSVGVRLVPTHKKSYQRALEEREFDDVSIHNDDYTRSQGYPGALTSSYVLCGYMCELMVNNFGDGFLKGGEISLKYIDGGVQQGDPITCEGIVTRIDDEDDAVNVTCDIWMTKYETKKVVAGTASARVNVRSA